MSLPAVPCLLSLACLPLAVPQGWTGSDGSVVTVPEGAARLVEPGTALERDVLQAVVGALLRESVAADGPGLAIAILQDGELLHAEAHGMADLERGVPCDVSTAFDMASVTKSVTAAAIATLIEEGAVDPDAGVRTYLPELSSAYAPVRVRDLVHHTGGVEDVEGTLALAGWRPGEAATNDQALRVLGRLQHLRFEPGTAHMYSNGGYLMLAEIVERVSGKALPDWAREELFAPLGMESALLVTGDGTPVAGRALPYARRDGALRQTAGTARYGAGGLHCSVVDLARWADALRTGAVLGDAVAERMRERGRLADGGLLDYAFGLQLSVHGGRERWMHAGSVPGGQSFLAFYPDQRIAVAAASNTLEDPNVARLVDEILTTVLGAASEPAGEEGRPRMILLSEDQEAPPASQGVAVDPARLATFAGSYEMDDGREGFVLTVAAEDERLLIGFGDQPSIEIFPLPSGAFVLPQADYEFRFVPEEGRVEMHVPRSVRTGEPLDVSGTRLSLPRLDVERAAGLIGTYRSEELGAFYAVVFDGNQLWLEHARHGRLRLNPIGEDAYSLDDRALAKLFFVREGDRVLGFDLEAYSWAARSFFAKR